MGEKRRLKALFKADLKLIVSRRRLEKALMGVLLALLLVAVLKMSGFEYSKNCLITRVMAPRRMAELDIRWWKLSGGDPAASHSDVLDFSKAGNSWLVDDILYVNSRPVARVLRLEHRFFMDYELTVVGLENGKIYHYSSK